MIQTIVKYDAPSPLQDIYGRTAVANKGNHCSGRQTAKNCVREILSC